MENKQTFGAFICQRRKDLGMTQKEFAARLFVTDSSVSKWERGLAYPDITLLQSICQVLQISEKELLNASEDTEGRRAEQLAKKYLQLIRNYRLIQYILYGLTLVTCFICNLAIQHTLSWFWIVLSSVILAASVTLLPVLTPEGRRGFWCLGGFTGSLLLLLAVCCLYTGGDWFLVAAVSVLFGLSVVFLPFVLRELPEPLRNRKFSLYLGSEFLLLALLFTVCCLSSGGDWLFSAILWTLFGLSIPFLPIILRQVPLGPFSTHKALLCLGIETALLLIGVGWETAADQFFILGLPITLLCLTLPWGLLGCIRYLPVSQWFRAAGAFWWIGLWFWLFPWVLDKIFAANGWLSQQPYSLRLPVDLLQWDDLAVLNANIILLVLLALGLAGALCTIFGVIRQKRIQR